MFYEKEKKFAVILFFGCIVSVAMLAICSGVTGKNPNPEPEVEDHSPSFMKDLESYQENMDITAETLCRRNNGNFRSTLIGYDCIINDQNKQIRCPDENTCYFQ